MGWLLLLALASLTAIALRVLRIAPALWSFAGAALMLGAAGYALQGRPALPGDPADATATRRPVDRGLVALRQDMWGRFTYAESYSIAADALVGAGATGAATKVLSGGLQQAPRVAQLWTDLGSAIVAHDGGGVVSPAAALAFDRGMRLAPRHPAPPFFHGIARIQAGELDAGRRLWLRALALSPRDAGYREQIAVRLVLLDRLIAMRAAAPRLDGGVAAGR